MEIAFGLPLHAPAASLLSDSFCNSVRLLVLVASLRRLAAAFAVLIPVDSRSFALLAPVRQTVSPAAVLTELTFFLEAPAFWTLLHCGDPPYLVTTIIARFSAPLYLKPSLPLSPDLRCNCCYAPPKPGEYWFIRTNGIWLWPQAPTGYLRLWGIQAGWPARSRAQVPKWVICP